MEHLHRMEEWCSAGLMYLHLLSSSVWFQTLVSCSLVNNAHTVCFGDVLNDAVMSGKGRAPSRALTSGSVLWKCRLGFLISYSKM